MDTPDNGLPRVRDPFWHPTLSYREMFPLPSHTIDVHAVAPHIEEIEYAEFEPSTATWTGRDPLYDPSRRATRIRLGTPAPGVRAARYSTGRGECLAYVDTPELRALVAAANAGVILPHMPSRAPVLLSDVCDLPTPEALTLLRLLLPFSLVFGEFLTGHVPGGLAFIASPLGLDIDVRRRALPTFSPGTIVVRHV